MDTIADLTAELEEHFRSQKSLFGKLTYRGLAPPSEPAFLRHFSAAGPEGAPRFTAVALPSKVCARRALVRAAEMR